METNVEQKIKGEVKRRKCNTSDVSFADIPEEIQTDILSRLPPKSLLRCRCVSKHWNDTLTIQTFFFKHSRSYDKHSKLAFVATLTNWRRGSVISFELNDDNIPKTTEFPIRGKDVYFTDFLMCNYSYMSNICNDLICLFNQSSSRVGLLSVRSRDIIQLPTINMKCVNYPFWYALGLDPVHKVFKVLSITYESLGKECTVKAAILTIGSKYWKQIDCKCLPSSLIKSLPMPPSTINSICLDGVIYWVHINICDLSVLSVVAFDLNRETFRDYKIVMTPRTSNYYLTSMKGCPTLLICKNSDEVQPWTLFNHKNPNAVWNRRSFTSHDFLTMFPNGYSNWTSVTGGNFLLRKLSITRYLVKPQEHDDSECSYLLYDLDTFAIEME